MTDATLRSRLGWITQAGWLLLPVLVVLSVVGLLGVTTAAPSEEIGGTAQAILINEDPSNPTGQRYPGTVSWRADHVTVAGRQAEIVVHADVTIPELKLGMEMNLSRNSDASLPASHLVDITFTGPPGEGSEIVTLPGMMLKLSEQTRGVPLRALAVKITSGRFLIGLSDVESDRAQNLRLLKERAWFDIPVVYADQRRGILAIEKGARGEQIFRDALQSWEEPELPQWLTAPKPRKQ
jgi:hypothetical protein